MSEELVEICHQDLLEELRILRAERIEHLALIDKFARQVDALRADIAAMQSGELTI